MTTLLSCKAQSALEKDIKQMKFAEQFSQLTDELMVLATAIQSENVYFTENTFDEKYDQFIDAMDPDFSTIEDEFASIHKQVIVNIDLLQEKYNDDQKSLDQIATIDAYQVNLGALFNILMQYHYTVLETRVIAASFDTVMKELIAALSEGNITTNEYNTALSAILEKNSDLLDADKIAVFDHENDMTSDEMKTVISRIASVKEEINQITLTSEADKSANEKLYQMFDLLSQSLKIYSEFEFLLEQSMDKEQLTTSIEKQTEDFTKEVLEKLTKPDFRGIF